jgi:hypothetical protein
VGEGATRSPASELDALRGPLASMLLDALGR